MSIRSIGSRRASAARATAIALGPVVLGFVALAIGAVRSPLAAQEVLFDFGAEWSYLPGREPPSDPPNAWREPDFDDSGWLVGETGIGYADADDATLLDDMEGNYTTVYLRRTVDVGSLAEVFAAVLSVDYDDGFVLYVNGTEVVRRNAGTEPDLAYDAVAAMGHEATGPELIDLTPALGAFELGTNTIAVHLLNVALNSSDLSFNARLALDDPVLICPTDLACTARGDRVSLEWTNSDAVAYESIRVLRDGAEIAGSPFAGAATAADDFEPGDFSSRYEVIARVDGVDCPPIECTPSSTIALVVVGDEWRYLKGTEAPPVDWAERSFDDAGWAAGPTGIGYGDGDDATILDDMEDGYFAVFCRSTFALPDASRVGNLTLFIDYDDSFVAYLNGEEVARSTNLGSAGDPVPFDAPATFAREAGTVEMFNVPPELIRSGDNVLAVEVHNATLSSSDLSLLPALDANICSIDGLACRYDLANDSVVIDWNPRTFDEFVVLRNGEPIDGSPFAGTTTSVVDLDPGDRDNLYEVVGRLPGSECSASCVIDCTDRSPDALACVLSIGADERTQAMLTWDPIPAATEIEVRREGALLATLPAGATSYDDPDVESDEGEDDTDYSVTFRFADETTCTIRCAASLCPESFACEIVDVGGVPRVRISWDNIVKTWTSVRIERDGVVIADAADAAALEFVDLETVLVAGEPHTYEFFPISPAGYEVGAACDATCTISLPFAELGPFPSPPGGWDYATEFSFGELRFNPVAGEPGNLDGRWVRAINRDEWDGSAPDDIGAAPDGAAPGGLALSSVAGGSACRTRASVLRLVNPGNTSAPAGSLATEFPEAFTSPNNRSLLFGLPIGNESRNLLRDGLTFAVRWRVRPAVESPSFLDAQPMGDGSSLVQGVGHVGALFVDDGTVATEGGAPASLSFALQSVGALQLSTAPATTLDGADIDRFWSLWVTIEDPEADDSYDLTVYLNGSATAVTRIGTGTGVALQAPVVDFGAPSGTYLTIGIPDPGGDADLELDLIAYVEGVVPPEFGSCGEVLFRRGDADSTGTANIADAIGVLNFLFGGGADQLDCPDAADVDDSGGVNIADPINLLNFLFGDGAPPAIPGNLDCGPDPSGDTLAACFYDAC